MGRLRVRVPPPGGSGVAPREERRDPGAHTTPVLAPQRSSSLARGGRAGRPSVIGVPGTTAERGRPSGVPPVVESTPVLPSRHPHPPAGRVPGGRTPMDPLTSVSTRATSQLLRADERQIPNAAGGFGFALDDDTRVLRFLTLGTDGGTYYATARELTAQNAPVVLRAARDR